MNLSAIRDLCIEHTNGENHPYVNQAAKLFVAGAAHYCVLKPVGGQNIFYATAIMAIVERTQSIVAVFLTKKAGERIANPDLKPVIGLAIDYCLLSKLSGMALVRLGMPIVSWNMTIAYFILSEIFSLVVCPSESCPSFTSFRGKGSSGNK